MGCQQKRRANYKMMYGQKKFPLFHVATETPAPTRPLLRKTPGRGQKALRYNAFHCGAQKRAIGGGACATLSLLPQSVHIRTNRRRPAPPPTDGGAGRRIAHLMEQTGEERILVTWERIAVLGPAGRGRRAEPERLFHMRKTNFTNV